VGGCDFGRLQAHVAALYERRFKRRQEKVGRLRRFLQLFFAILAAGPPANALAICAAFEQMQSLSSSPPAASAIAMFTSAVQHIREFSAGQLVPAEGESGDPLGIA
jgi:hypothetical protein